MSTGAVGASGLEFALLGLLRPHPMHAYEMHVQLQRTEELGLVWHLKQGNLYAHLAKLEAAGYVVAATQPRGNRPPRKMLRLTPRGEEAFLAWVASPVAHGRDFRQEFLAKLYFASREEPATVRPLLARQRQATRGWLDTLRAQCEAVDADRPFERLVLGYRAGQIEATLRWLDECATLLDVSPDE